MLLLLRKNWSINWFGVPIPLNEIIYTCFCHWILQLNWQKIYATIVSFKIVDFFVYFEKCSYLAVSISKWNYILVGKCCYKSLFVKTRKRRANRLLAIAVFSLCRSWEINNFLFLWSDSVVVLGAGIALSGTMGNKKIRIFFASSYSEWFQDSGKQFFFKIYWTHTSYKFIL